MFKNGNLISLATPFIYLLKPLSFICFSKYLTFWIKRVCETPSDQICVVNSFNEKNLICSTVKAVSWKQTALSQPSGYKTL